MATMSIVGLYNADNTIFDDLQLPTQISSIRQDVINEILLECSELEVIYPDPDLMKNAIKSWSSVMQQTWSKWAAAIFATYNPLWNVDATIHEHTDGASIGSGSMSGSNTETDSSTSFNSGSMAARDKAEIYANQTTGDNRNWGETKDTTRTGNIGVTSSQQLIMQEIEVAKNNVVMYIINSFKKRFCLLIY